MLVAYKTEILPTEEQKEIVNRTIGVARFVKNFYIAHNQEVYKSGGKFVSGVEFSKWLNNNYIPNNPDKLWIKDIYARSTKHAIMEMEKAFRKFFQGKANFPKFKKKKYQDVSMYFVKNDKKTIIRCERHQIGVGIDLGLKDFAILSTGKTYKNINKSGKIRKIEKQLKRQQRKLSRKYESEKNVSKKNS